VWKRRLIDWLSESERCNLYTTEKNYSLKRRTRPKQSTNFCQTTLLITLITTLCLKKVPTFKLSVTLSNLNRFSQFLYCWKAWNLLQNPYDIMHLTLGMFLHYLGKLKISADIPQILSHLTLLLIHKILIFSVFNIASFSPYWLQIKFSMLLLFYLITFAINLWHRKFVMVFSDEDKILLKNTLNSACTVTRVEELKSVHLKYAIFIFFHIWYYRWISAENLNFWFLR